MLVFGDDQLAYRTSSSSSSKGLQSRIRIAKQSFKCAKIVMEQTPFVACMNAQVVMISPDVMSDEIEASVVGETLAILVITASVSFTL